ncbi:MAG: hypothetical protein LBB18_01415 [Puniceicoccales bacterium]|jgi:hypothetical protein|nr:hypothetical protein [Puniceicoccales bacterium]
MEKNINCIGVWTFGLNGGSFASIKPVAGAEDTVSMESCELFDLAQTDGIPFGNSQQKATHIGEHQPDNYRSCDRRFAEKASPANISAGSSSTRSYAGFYSQNETVVENCKRAQDALSCILDPEYLRPLCMVLASVKKARENRQGGEKGK